MTLDGTTVGRQDKGSREGPDGPDVVVVVADDGLYVREEEGDTDDGNTVGREDVGSEVGAAVGIKDGPDGDDVGTEEGVDGTPDGTEDGVVVRENEGGAVGVTVGRLLGAIVGTYEGAADGALDGVMDNTGAADDAGALDDATDTGVADAVGENEGPEVVFGAQIVILELVHVVPLLTVYRSTELEIIYHLEVVNTT